MRHCCMRWVNMPQLPLYLSFVKNWTVTSMSLTQCTSSTTIHTRWSSMNCVCVAIWRRQKKRRKRLCRLHVISPLTVASSPSWLTSLRCYTPLRLPHRRWPELNTLFEVKRSYSVTHTFGRRRRFLPVPLPQTLPKQTNVTNLLTWIVVTVIKIIILVVVITSYHPQHKRKRKRHKLCCRYTRSTCKRSMSRWSR